MSEHAVRHFTLFAEECSRTDCQRRATHFGFCFDHYMEEVDWRAENLAQMGLHQDTWPCFPDDQAWREYEVMSLAARTRGRRRPANPCRDCTPQYQAEMLEQRRCRHPETVFVVGSKGLEGINAKSMMRWNDACGGFYGKVVRLPSPDVRMRVLRGGVR